MSNLQLQTCLIWLTGLICTISGELSYRQYMDSSEDHECSMALYKATHSSTVAPSPPEISGEWTSHRCEIRPGPEFLLRKYFFKRTSFSAHQYYYADEDCTKPVYSIVAKGSYHLKQESWRVPGGLEARHRVSEVYVIPYNQHVADQFERLLRRFCPAMKPKLTTVEPLKKVKILQFPRYNKFLKSRRKHVMEDFDCSGLFNFTMNELQLVRLEIYENELNDLERNKSIDLKRDHRELFLGDLHTRTKSRQSHRPTNYQTSLLDAKTEGCQVCGSIANSNDFLPPILQQHGEKSLYMPGKWVSERCETRQNGQFLTRMLTFLPDGKSWQCQYDFYNDPKCRDGRFTVYGKGHYIKERKSQHIPSATEFTFRTTNLKIEPKDFWILEYLNSYEGKQCGKPNSWKLGVKQDVTFTGGCITLGIQLPNIEYELIKEEFLHEKEILFVGQKPSDGELMRNSKTRPTSFQSPLVKCGQVSQMNSPSLGTLKLKQEDHEIIHTKNNISSGLQISLDVFLLFACLLSMFM